MNIIEGIRKILKDKIAIPDDIEAAYINYASLIGNRDRSLYMGKTPDKSLVSRISEYETKYPELPNILTRNIEISRRDRENHDNGQF